MKDISSINPKKILVCQLRQIGDVVLATPSVSLLHKNILMLKFMSSQRISAHKYLIIIQQSVMSGLLRKINCVIHLKPWPFTGRLVVADMISLLIFSSFPAAAG